MTRPRTDRPLRLISRADAARRRGCARSTVSRACEPGGPLFPALVGDRLNLDHPAFRQWEYSRAERRFVTVEEFAELAGKPVDAVRAELAKPAYDDAVLFFADEAAEAAFIERCRAEQKKIEGAAKKKAGSK